MSAVAYAGVGLLAVRDHVVINATASDPHLLRNWLRIGAVNSLLSILVVGVVEYVVRHVEANSRAANEALKRLRSAYDKLETTKEDERRFLSHELHDELGQTLTALKLSLQIAARPQAAPEPKGTPSARPLALVEDLIARVRKISLDLRPPLLDEVGLVSALRAHLESQARLSGIAMQLHADDTPFRLPADYEIACFRVVQESVTNVIRHAAAHRVDVRVSRSASQLALSITDDGCGFDPATLDDAAAHGHLGVLGMRERIRARAGQFRLTSTPGQGTTVEIELDVPPIAR
jgi:signal transduction histidine kinase